MSSVNTAIQLITRDQADSSATAARPAATCSPALARGPVGLRPRRGPRRRARLRPRRLDGRRRPRRRRPRQGAAAGGVQARRRRRARRPHPRRQGDARRPRRRSSATSTSATRSSQYADFVGDSFQLANAAQTQPDAEAIVFCGVHFMAETADILSRPEQAVILPNLAAGCSMADMADIDSVEECWEQLEELYGTEPDADGRVPVIPVTYMNSSAALKGVLRRATAASSAPPPTPRPCWSGRSSAASACCSSPTSTWAATPPRRWASRWSRCRCGTRASRSAATTEQTLQRRPRDPLARLLLGAQALHRRPDREGPRRVPRRAR